MYCTCYCVCVLQVSLFASFMSFQVAEESELPVPSNAGPESAERASFPGDTVSPSSNVQLPSATIASSALTADNASTLASLRMVQLIVCCYVPCVCACACPCVGMCVHNHVNAPQFTYSSTFLFLILFKLTVLYLLLFLFYFLPIKNFEFNVPHLKMFFFFQKFVHLESIAKFIYT